MQLTSQKTIQSMLQAQGTKPRKGLGQNFLVSKGALGNMLKAADLKKSDTVLEIGPGIGTLTRELAQNAKRVIAVEKDRALVEILRETTKDLQNIEIVQGDILKLGTKYKIQDTKYKVVANLPYYITSPVIRKFLEAPHNPALMVLMVQKEVAQRICARPTSPGRSPGGRAKPPRMSLLAVSVQFYAEPEIISYVPRSCFWPQPKVDSAILLIKPHLKPPIGGFNVFFRIVRAGFKQPRKQLLNNLSSGLGKKREEIAAWLKGNGIDPIQRAETLDMQDWIKLAKDYTMEE